MLTKTLKRLLLLIVIKSKKVLEPCAHIYPDKERPKTMEIRLRVTDPWFM